jgi:hypothetical protein
VCGPTGETASGPALGRERVLYYVLMYMYLIQIIGHLSEETVISVGK